MFSCLSLIFFHNGFDVNCCQRLYAVIYTKLPYFNWSECELSFKHETSSREDNWFKHILFNQVPFLSLNRSKLIANYHKNFREHKGKKETETLQALNRTSEELYIFSRFSSPIYLDFSEAISRTETGVHLKLMIRLETLGTLCTHKWRWGWPCWARRGPPSASWFGRIRTQHSRRTVSFRTILLASYFFLDCWARAGPHGWISIKFYCHLCYRVFTGYYRQTNFRRLLYNGSFSQKFKLF